MTNHCQLSLTTISTSKRDDSNGSTLLDPCSLTGQLGLEPRKRQSPRYILEQSHHQKRSVGVAANQE
jgi:hypothetical protein